MRSSELLSLSCTRGVSAASIETMTLRVCSTLLCLRLCMSAAGIASGWPVRNTAVPLTRSLTLLPSPGQKS